MSFEEKRITENRLNAARRNFIYNGLLNYSGMEKFSRMVVDLNARGFKVVLNDTTNKLQIVAA